MTATRNMHGAWVVSGIVAGYLVTRRYYGFTKAQAVSMWRKEQSSLRV